MSVPYESEQAVVSPAAMLEAGEDISVLPIESLVGQPPEVITTYVRSLHESDRELGRRDLDLLLIGSFATDAEVEHLGPRDIDAIVSRSNADGAMRLRAQYPNEIPWDGRSECIWTPYSEIKKIRSSLKLSASDKVYDLGAGYGRFVLYTAITSEAQSNGVEMVSERARLLRANIARLGLSNAEVKEGKVQEVDYSDGDVFYMYSPFSDETFENVFDHLEEIAATKPITIINKHANVLNAQYRGRFRGLELVGRPNAQVGNVFFFESAEIAHSPDSRVINMDARAA